MLSKAWWYMSVFPTAEVKAGAPGIQGQPRLHPKFEVSLATGNLVSKNQVKESEQKQIP